MKLSEADFRPKRRAGYVPSPPRRKIPLFRLLILIAAAILVYRHFDSYWPKLRSLVRSSSNPALKSGSLASDGGLVWMFYNDSSTAILNKARAPDASFCASLESMQTGLCNQVRAVLAKGRWLKALNSPVASKVELHFSRMETGATRIPILVALEGRDGGKGFRYQRMNEEDAWCDSLGSCLSLRPPRIPLVHGRSTDPVADELISRWTSAQSGVFPVLPGRVIRVDSSVPEDHRVTLYHGRELYTTYEGLKKVANGLIVGSSTSPNLPIGEAGDVDSLSLTDSSRYAIRFRVEQAGMPLDPMEFLASQGLKP